MLRVTTGVICAGLFGIWCGVAPAAIPSRTETIQPIHNATFNKNGKCPERKQGGNPRTIDGMLVFDGSMDGNRQVDPQIAVGGGYVLHGTNGGLIIYDKQGHFVQGVSQNCFNGGIDPKLFFDPNNRVFGFDMWKYWDKEKKKPVNISVSETSDPPEHGIRTRFRLRRAVMGAVSASARSGLAIHSQAAKNRRLS